MGDPENLWVRYFFPGQRRQDGTLTKLSPDLLKDRHLCSRDLYTLLRSRGVPVERYKVHVYHYGLEGFVPVEDTDQDLIPLPPPEIKTLDVKLDMNSVVTDFQALGAEGLKVKGPQKVRGGWFGIGIIRGKTEANHDERSSDTSKVHRHIPMIRYDGLEDFASHCPYSAPWVAIECGGEDLVSFSHPSCAIYILGAEDNGLSKSMVSSCAFHVSVPAARPELTSFNVATAGALVMYDRLAKDLSSDATEDA